MDHPTYKSRPPPPQYTDKRTHAKSGIAESSNYGNGSWLLRRTSFTIESTPATAETNNDSFSDQQSLTSSARSEEKRRLRNVISRFGRMRDEGVADGRQSRSSEGVTHPYDGEQFGTTVSIEVGHHARPRTQRRHEMRGLEEAASMKRWSGSGKPADAWGKLAKDPELWDEGGDTLVYFGYQRPEASFRIHSSLLENTKSEILISKLRDGWRPCAKPTATRLHDPSHNSRANKGPLSSLNPNSRIKYEIHFPAPEGASRLEILRYHTTTRNLFALLLQKPLVGLTFYQALTDLLERIKLYMPHSTTNPAQILVQHILKLSLHDISNDPGAAAGLLAWSEDIEVRWAAGWREGFVHCAGMYKHVQSLPEYRDLSNSTCVLLNRAHLELQARVEELEWRLASFEFEDLWSPSSSPPSATERNKDKEEKIKKPWLYVVKRRLLLNNLQAL
ncbi:MAG: hypothetical protein Q9191_003102, partial [Dirinaria sp. TL-2023a]